MYDIFKHSVHCYEELQLKQSVSNTEQATHFPKLIANVLLTQAVQVVEELQL